MAQYSRIEVAKVMQESGMVPLFYHPDVELGKKVLKACYDGGARLLEFTARGDFAYEVFAELNKFAIKELPGMIMGVGSITDAGQPVCLCKWEQILLSPQHCEKILQWFATVEKYYGLRVAAR